MASRLTACLVCEDPIQSMHESCAQRDRLTASIRVKSVAVFTQLRTKLARRRAGWAFKTHPTCSGEYNQSVWVLKELQGLSYHSITKWEKPKLKMRAPGLLSQLWYYPVL
jgi:hypothetical protein